MRRFSPKQLVLIFLALAVFVVGLVLWVSLRVPEEPISTERKTEYVVIGTSVEGRDIEAYTFLPASETGGESHLLFVGGVHGGYEWNSVLLSYRFIDYLEANPSVIPENIIVTVVPSANPDGVYEVVGKEGRFSLADVPAGTNTTGEGRFNARGVDLNRNFDCKWQPKSLWRGNEVSAGTEAFSEPEAVALRDFVLKQKPDAVIFWHSQANAVYASECEEGILPETLVVMNTYSRASGYQAVDSFDAYEITGDAEGWLASLGIPAITVELSSHETVEWERNKAGAQALFEYYDDGTGLSR